MYERPATVQTPALVIYLIDASDSMNEPCGTSPKKITLVQQALQTTRRWMVDHSHHTNGVENRYKIAILAYSTTVIPVVKDIYPLTEIMTYGNLELKAGGKSDTAKGFEAVESLLRAHLHEY